MGSRWCCEDLEVAREMGRGNVNEPVPFSSGLQRSRTVRSSNDVHESLQLRKSWAFKVALYSFLPREE